MLKSVYGSDRTHIHNTILRTLSFYNVRIQIRNIIIQDPDCVSNRISCKILQPQDCLKQQTEDMAEAAVDVGLDLLQGRQGLA